MSTTKRTRKQETCTCDAYPFPHRRTGGDCDGSYYCIKCGGRVWELDSERMIDGYRVYGYRCSKCGHVEDED